MKRSVYLFGAFLPFLFALSVRAQDAGMMAAQQAQMANQQAMQDAQMANQQAMQASQAVSGTPIVYGACLLPRPTFSVKPGSYSGSIQVRLKDKGRNTTIYYTTDGWSPTVNSKVYDGPITLDHTTQLKAMANADYGCRSATSAADYKFPAAKPEPPAPVVVPVDTVAKGTEIPLVFETQVDSATAEVGDKVKLGVAVPVTLAGQNVPADKMKAEGTVTQVDRKAFAGQAGDITVRIDWLSIDGVRIPLQRVVTTQGQDHYGRVLATIFIPVVGVAGLAQHGKDVTIEPGTSVVATVAATTQVLPTTAAAPHAQTDEK
jgi:hypothetical protein